MSLNEPIGQDKEGHEISLIDILKSKNKDIVEEISLNKEKIYQHLHILDDREKEVVIARFGLDHKEEIIQLKSQKSCKFPEVMCHVLKKGRS